MAFLIVHSIPFFERPGVVSFKTVCSASHLVFRKSAFEIALDNALVSIKPTMVSFPKSVGEEEKNLLSFFNKRFFGNGRIFVFLRGTGWSCGMISVSMTGFGHFAKLGSGLIFGDGEVVGSYGLTIHKSINVYLSLSDMYESVTLSSPSVCSGDLSKLSLNSNSSWL